MGTKKAIDEHKKSKILIYTTEKEREEIKNNAWLVRSSVSNYLRKKGLEKSTKK